MSSEPVGTTLRRGCSVLAFAFVLGAVASLASAQPAPVPIGPSGPGQPANPTYSWYEVSGISSYYFNVFRFGELFLWDLSTSSVCASGICSVTPAQTHTAGEYTWSVATVNPDGILGPMSETLSFTVGSPPPNPVTLIAPSGGGQSASPTFEWTSAPEATGYNLYVFDSLGGLEFTDSYVASAVCPSNCSVTPTHTFPDDAYSWYIIAFNTFGNGPQSEVFCFRVGPPLDAWGQNDFGQLGTNTLDDEWFPT